MPDAITARAQKLFGETLANAPGGPIPLTERERRALAGMVRDEMTRAPGHRALPTPSLSRLAAKLEGDAA